MNTKEDLTNALPPNEDDKVYVWDPKLASYVGTTTGQFLADWQMLGGFLH